LKQFKVSMMHCNYPGLSKLIVKRKTIPSKRLID
jgi:hypothetical protein